MFLTCSNIGISARISKLPGRWERSRDIWERSRDILGEVHFFGLDLSLRKCHSTRYSPFLVGEVHRKKMHLSQK